MYGYIGSMKTRPGERDRVVSILVKGSSALADVGCRQYTVAVARDDDTTIWMSEVWESREAHDESLRLPETKAAIAKAMPFIAGGFTRVETVVSGGLGLP